MATISTQFTVVDKMTSTLNNITSSVDVMLGSLNSVDESINNGFDSSAISKAEQEFQKINNQVQGIDGNIGAAEQEQQKFNSAVDRGTTKMNSLLAVATKMFGVASVVLAIKNAAVGMYSSATVLEATEAKFNTVFAGFEDVAQGIVDEFQMLTPATESATRSMVSGIQDLLVPMGFLRSEATDMTGETMNLVGALTNFNSATHKAEDVASAFSSALTGEYTSLKALGIQVSATTIQDEVLRMGLAKTTDEITSQMKAQALLSLAYEQSSDALAAYNAESLDTTTRAGLLKSSFTDTFAMAGQSMLPKINQMLAQIQGYMPTITAMVYGFGNAFSAVLAGASLVLGVVMAIATFVVDNWSIISPIIMGIVTALGLYNGALLANMAITQGAAAVKAAFVAVQTFLSIGYGVLTGSTAAASAAQLVYNSALLACPITWIILAVVALVAIFYAVIAAVNKFAGTTLSATGIICGAFAVAGAVIWNIIIGLVNYIISAGVEIYNLIGTFANFFANVFNNPVGAIVGLFSGMFDYILATVQAAAKLIDMVLKTDMSSSIQNFRNNIADSTAELVGEQTVIMEKATASDYHFSGLDYGDAWNAGMSFGEGIDDTVGGMFGGSGSTSSLAGYEQDMMASAVESIATDTSDISTSVSDTAEELAYLRDLAEQEAINRFTTAEVKIDMTGMTNKIDSSMDLDGVLSTLTDSFAEALEITAEGVHA